MARQYQTAELLRLRASPLVCKPASLPSVEQWMGPPQDQVQRKPAMNRGKTEDSTSHTEITGARPSLYETRHISRSSTSGPSDILTGPPKTTFTSSSAARSSSKTFDSPRRSTFGSYGDDTAKNEQHSFRDKSTRDRDKGDRDGDRPRESRSGTVFSRRGGKEEGEAWSNMRQRKSLGPEDADRISRKNGERDFDKDRADVRDSRTPQHRGFDSYRREGDRDVDSNTTTRRNGIGRGRNEPSWYRDDDRQEGEGLEDNREATRTRDWREGDKGARRGGDRDWHRGKVEQDPEWMEEPEPESATRNHTAEDLERWMRERHKADRKSPDDAVAVEQAAGHERSASGRVADPGARKIENPLVLDPAVDKFFGLWNDSKVVNEGASVQGADEKVTREVPKTTASKTSRFKGMWDSKPDLKPADVEPPAPSLPLASPKDSASEDREGFQRILQMLGGGNVPSGNQTPYSSGLPPATTLSTLHRQVNELTENNMPPREPVSKKAPPSPPIHSPRSRKSIGLEGLLRPQSPREGHVPQNRDSEYLLNLLQQTGADMNQTNQRQRIGTAPGILPFPNSLGQRSDVQHHSTAARYQPGFYDEATLEDVRPRDKLNPNANLDRRDHRIPGPGMFDDSTTSNVQRHPYQSLPNNLGIPSGLQRPPGLEQLPPGFGQHTQQQRSSMVAPPPGFQGPVRNPNLFPPGLMPNISGLNVSNDRGVPFGMRQMGPGGPPGMPPPGFTGINGPPPGFPPLSMNPNGRISPPGRMFYGAGAQSRPSMDVFAESAQLGLPGRGGVGAPPPGQYRRQE